MRRSPDRIPSQQIVTASAPRSLVDRGADASFNTSKASTSRSLRAVVEPPGRLTRNPSPLSFLRRLNLVEVVDIALGILPAHHLTAHRDLHGHQVCDDVATQLGTGRQ